MTATWAHAVIVVASFLIPLLVAFGVTPLVGRLGERLGIVDRPGPDRVNTRPLPRIGGIALYLAFLVGLGATFALGLDRRYDPTETSRLALLVIGGSIVFLVMLADDAIDLTPRTKLLWQVGAALLVALPAVWNERQAIVIADMRLPVFGTFDPPIWFSIVFTVFWLVGMMNTVNWIDGLDGLAGGVTLIAAGVLFVHTYFQPAPLQQFTIAVLPVILAGAVAGFLPYNWHPSRIIMGDSGAMFLGFALGSIAIIGGAKLATTMLALAVPIIDVAWLILARLWRRRSPLQRDATHLHHRLYELGLSQRQVVLIYYALCVVSGTLAMVLDSGLTKLFVLIGVGGVLGLLLLLLTRRRSAAHGLAEGHEAEQRLP